jgi:hypothetical protein
MCNWVLCRIETENEGWDAAKTGELGAKCAISATNWDSAGRADGEDTGDARLEVLRGTIIISSAQKGVQVYVGGWLFYNTTE